jgi:hypothetical protein
MIISDLEHLEVVSEETQIVGGNSVSVASGAGSVNTDYGSGYVSSSSDSSSNNTDTYYYSSRGTSAYNYTSGSTYYPY